MSSKVPVSLIVDDGGVVNMFYFHHMAVEHEFRIPVSFTRKFAALCKANGIRGKFSIVPMPAGLGRLDEKKVARIPAGHIRSHIREMKKNIEGDFSITPEILTHFMAYDLWKNRFTLTNEEAYFSNLPAEKISDYVGLALEILCNLGFTPAGVTSPWQCGLDNEENYAKGIGMAFRKVMKKDRSFYFLHCSGELLTPKIMCNSPETGKVITIPGTVSDPFYGTNLPATAAKAVKHTKKMLDCLLTEDGKKGVIRELFEKKLPINIITHWQNLFSDGRLIGLAGLGELAERINRTFGKEIQWMNFEELAETWDYSEK